MSIDATVEVIRQQQNRQAEASGRLSGLARPLGNIHNVLRRLAGADGPAIYDELMSNPDVLDREWLWYERQQAVDELTARQLQQRTATDDMAALGELIRQLIPATHTVES